MNKSEKIIKHLKEHKEITPWDAIYKYNYTRLSDIIFRLRRKGYDIETINEKNADGRGTHARYVLKGEPNGK